MTNYNKLEAKLSRLALESNETPVFANVWSKNEAYLLLCGELNLPYASAQTIAANIFSKIDLLWNQQATDVDTMEEILEQILLELNKTLIHLFSPYPYNPNSPRYHLTLSAVRGEEICVSVLGNASAFVVSPEKFTNIVKVGTNNETNSSWQRKPIFQQLISGCLKANEAVFLVNPNALDYFSVTQLRKLVGQYSPGQCVNQIRSIIKNLEYQPAISLIIYKLETAEAVETIKTISKVNNKTEHFLNKLPFFKKHPAAIPINNPNPRTNTTVIKKTSVTKKALSAINATGLVIKNIPWRKNDIKNKLTNSLNDLATKYNHFPSYQKILSWVIILLIFILSYSIVSSGRNNLSQKNIQKFNQEINSIKDTFSQIEAAIIYRDNNQTNYLLSQVKTELDQLPTNGAYQDLWTKYQELSQKSQKQTIFNQPELWQDLTKIAPGPWLKFINADKVMVFNQLGNILQLNDNSTNKIAELPSTAGKPKIILPCQGNRLLINTNSNNQLFVDLKTKKITTIPRTLPQLTDAVVYGENRLYFIAGTDIERSDISTNDLTSPIKWLKGSEQLPNNASSLTIDGSIFVATLTGNIIKYSRGYKKDLVIATINPPLQKITKIKTTSEQDNLYLLDSDNKRIVILNKKGELINQLILPTLNNLQDFAIVNNQQDLLLLNDNRIYKIKLP